MGKKLSRRAKNAIIVVCALTLPILLLGCLYGAIQIIVLILNNAIDFNGEKERKYIIEYMDAIPVTCTEYKLALPDSSKYSLYIGGGKIDNSSTIIVDGVEKKIDIIRNEDKDYSLIIDDQIININEAVMAEKSAEYVTISEMWYRYADDMENYKDNMPLFSVCAFDNNVFIATDFRRGGGAWWFRYKGSMPACLFKYDIESDTVLYAGYLMRDGMHGAFQIERTEQV